MFLMMDIISSQKDNTIMHSDFGKNFLLDFVEYNKLIAPSAKLIN